MSFATAFLFGSPSVAMPAEIIGDYLCTILQKTGTVDTHPEGSGPPKAFIDDQMSTRLKMRMSLTEAEKSKFHMIEIPYSSPNRDQTDWHTKNDILHSIYRGWAQLSGYERLRFVIFGETVHANADGDYSFDHVGLEWAGGEDSHLPVRWGRCKRVK